MSPVRAILLHSSGRKPWVNYWNTSIEPPRGGTPLSQTNARAESAAPHRSSYYLLFVCTQGSVRAFGTLATLGYAGVSCLRHS